MAAADAGLFKIVMKPVLRAGFFCAVKGCGGVAGSQAFIVLCLWLQLMPIP